MQTKRVHDHAGWRGRRRAGHARADPGGHAVVRRGSSRASEKDYATQTKANVISTAGDAALSVSDPGHLTNGAFTLPEPLRVSLSKTTWTGPVSNDKVDIAFNQLIKANDPLRTGTYSKTLTFTLSTTQPWLVMALTAWTRVHAVMGR